MVLVVGQNSTWQKTYQLRTLTRGNVNRVHRVFSSAAGKGANACRVLRLYGIEHELHAYIGGPDGHKFKIDCDADGITGRFTVIKRETRICVTVLEQDGSMTEIVEPAPMIAATERAAFHETLFDRLPSARLLAIQGTAMVGEADNCFRKFVEAAKACGTVVILDSYKTHARLALEASPEILKINQVELGELTGLPVDTLKQRKEAYRYVRERFGISWIVITRGGNGAEGSNGSVTVQSGTAPVRPVNPIGSGDSATAGITAVISRDGRPFNELKTDDQLFRYAILEAVVTGTANCLSLKPGEIRPSDMAAVRSAAWVNAV